MNMNIYIYIHIHTYIHTYIPTYIHTYMHACMHACIHTYIHTYIHTHTCGVAEVQLHRAFVVLNSGNLVECSWEGQVGFRVCKGSRGFSTQASVTVAS